MPIVEARPGPVLALLRASGRALLAPGRAVAAALAVAWMGLIWYASSISHPPSKHTFLGAWIANAAHAPLFGLLGLWLALSLPRNAGPVGWARLGVRERLFVLAVVGAYGAADEWHQSRTPGRDATVYDVITDLTGAACVLWVAAHAGAADARESGLRWRLAAGVLACLLAGLLSTLLG